MQDSLIFPATVTICGIFLIIFWLYCEGFFKTHEQRAMAERLRQDKSLDIPEFLRRDKERLTCTHECACGYSEMSEPQKYEPNGCTEIDAEALNNHIKNKSLATLLASKGRFPGEEAQFYPSQNGREADRAEAQAMPDVAGMGYYTGPQEQSDTSDYEYVTQAKKNIGELNMQMEQWEARLNAATGNIRTQKAAHEAERDYLMKKFVIPALEKRIKEQRYRVRPRLCEDTEFDQHGNRIKEKRRLSEILYAVEAQVIGWRDTGDVADTAGGKQIGTVWIEKGAFPTESAAHDAIAALEVFDNELGQSS